MKAMSRTLAEAFELLVSAEQLAPRLDAAATALSQLAGLDDEQQWLAAARARLASAQIDTKTLGQLLSRALRLPDLAAQKNDRGKLLQAAVADEVERLQAAITLAGGARSPLLDTLFMDLKVPAIRKITRTELEKFCIELERRLMSSYAQRLLASERYASVVPAVTSLRTAIGIWASVFVDPPLEGPAADALRDELFAASNAVDLPVRQARLLAQAALLPATELFDAAGVLTAVGKSKRAVAEGHPILEKDPPDPLLPTDEERAEIEALHASA
ncbi:MAG: hypothetical protein SFX73_36265 [Kofleriaceae bacterium]|nr:hypothetical protein [Kofleriaceae bacterium]